MDRRTGELGDEGEDGAVQRLPVLRRAGRAEPVAQFFERAEAVLELARADLGVPPAIGIADRRQEVGVPQRRGAIDDQARHRAQALQQVPRDLGQHDGAPADDDVQRAGQHRVDVGEAARGDQRPLGAHDPAGGRRHRHAARVERQRVHRLAQDRRAVALGRGRLGRHHPARADVPGGLPLEDAVGIRAEGEIGEAPGQGRPVQLLERHPERLAGAAVGRRDPAGCPPGAARRRRPRRAHGHGQHPDLLLKPEAALLLDLGVARDRALGQARPDRIAVEDAVDAPLVVVAAEDIAMIGAHRRLIRPDQHHTIGLPRQVSRGGRADQPLADDRDTGPLRKLAADHAIPPTMHTPRLKRPGRGQYTERPRRCARSRRWPPPGSWSSCGYLESVSPEMGGSGMGRGRD